MDANFGLVLRAKASKSEEQPKRSAIFFKDSDVLNFVESYNHADDMKELKEVTFFP